MRRCLLAFSIPCPVFLDFSGGNVWFTTGGDAQCNGPGDETPTDDCYPKYIEAADLRGAVRLRRA